MNLALNLLTGLPPVRFDAADTVLHPGAVPDAAAVCDRLLQEIPWRQETLHLFGRDIPQPRLTAYQGDVPYTYSGLTLPAAPWHPLLAALRDRCAAMAGTPFNSVLANLYRDGADSMDWHADDEPELGPAPVVASVSLGAPRRFQMRRKDRRGETLCLTLGDGDILIMAGRSQLDWLHRVPKTRRPIGPRLNLTFRRISDPWPDPPPRSRPS